MISTFVYLLFIGGIASFILSYFNTKYGLSLLAGILFLCAGIGSFQVEREYCQDTAGWSCWITETVDVQFVTICGVLMIFSFAIAFLKYTTQSVEKVDDKNAQY